MMPQPRRTILSSTSSSSSSSSSSLRVVAVFLLLLFVVLLPVDRATTAATAVGTAAAASNSQSQTHNHHYNHSEGDTTTTSRSTAAAASTNHNKNNHADDYLTDASNKSNNDDDDDWFSSSWWWWPHDIPPECQDSSHDDDHNATLSFNEQHGRQPRRRRRRLLHRYNSLTCWFYFLRLTIPEQSFHSGFLKIKIQDLTCTNFTLQTIQSHYQPAANNRSNPDDDDNNNNNDNDDKAWIIPDDDDDDDDISSSASLSLGLGNLSATCTGKYHATGGFSGHLYAVLATDNDNNNNNNNNNDNGPTTTVDNDNDNDNDTADDTTDQDDPTLDNPIRLVWTLHSTTHNNSWHIRQPSHLNTSLCQSSFQVPSLHFSGSLSAKTINLFRHSIQSYVETQVSSQFCPALATNLLDPLLNSYLQQITQYLNPYLVPTSSSSSFNSNNNNNNKKDSNETNNSSDDSDNHDQDNNNNNNKEGDDNNNDSNNNDNNNDDYYGDLAVRWSTQAPLLRHSLQFLNGFLRHHLNQGFLPQQQQHPDKNNNNNNTTPHSLSSPCGFFFHGVNGVIRELLELQSNNYSNSSDGDDDDDDDWLWYALPLPNRLHNISMIWPGYGALQLNVYEIALAGLDQWTAVQLFQLTDDDTFASRLYQQPASSPSSSSMDDKNDQNNNNNNNNNDAQSPPFQIRLRAALNVSSIPGGIFFFGQEDEEPLHEDFTVTLQLSHLDWNSTLALWVDQDAWQTQVTMGVLLNVLQGLFSSSSTTDPDNNNNNNNNNIPRDSLLCLLESILDFSAPQLSLDTHLQSLRIVPTLPPKKYYNSKNSNHDLVDDDDDDHVVVAVGASVSAAESLEQDLDALFNHALELLVQEYPEYISSAMAGLVQGPVRQALNAFLRRITNTSHYHDNDNDRDDNNENNNSYREPSPAGHDALGVCPDFSNATTVPHLLNFSRVAPLAQLQTFLSHSKTIRHLNKYIQCAADTVAGAVLVSLDPEDQKDQGERTAPAWGWWSFWNFLGLSSSLKSSDGVDNDLQQYRLSLTNMSFSNVGQITSLSLLAPQANGLELANSVVYGTNRKDDADADNHTKESVPELFLQLALQLPNQISATTNITILWNDLSMRDVFLLQYNVNQLKSFGLARVFEHGHCLLVPIDDFQVSFSSSANDDDDNDDDDNNNTRTNAPSAFRIGLFAVNVSTTVTIRQDYDGDNKNNNNNNENGGESNNNTTTDTYTLSTLDYPAVQELVAAILDWVANSGRDFTNLALIYSLSQASQLCAVEYEDDDDEHKNKHDPHKSHHHHHHRHGGSDQDKNDDDNDNNDYDPQDVWAMVLIMAAMLLLAQPAVLLLPKAPQNPTANTNVSGRQNISLVPRMSAAVGEPDSQLTEPLLDPGVVEHFVSDSSGHNGNSSHNNPFVNADNKSDDDNSEGKHPPALGDSPRIPWIVRVCLPMLMLVTIFVLLSSNLSVGASVELTAVIGHKTFKLPSLFEFTLVQTAREMWNAGIYPVFFLVVVFSGIWPYAKLVIMLFCWESNKIRDGPRGQLLLAMDSLGKFSLVDTYVLVLMMVAFRYHLRFFDADAIGLDVMVVPQYGFYGFLLATTLSLVSGHAAVYYHRVIKTVFQGTTRTTTTADQSDRSSLSIFYHSFQVAGVRRQLSLFSKLMLLFLLVAAAVLLGIGITKKSFIFEFGGLAGIALGEDKRRTAYSLVSLGTAIPGSSKATLGTYILMAVYFFYAVVAPLACLYLLFILLVFPLTVKRQLVVLFLAEIANAWSAVEVFCLSIVAALLEISAFASFIIGDRCETINEIVRDYWPSQTDYSDANCYTVRSSVKWDAGYLIGGAILNSFVVSLTLRLVHAAMKERMEEEQQSLLGHGTSFDVLSQPSRPSRCWAFLTTSPVLLWIFFRRPTGSESAAPANRITTTRSTTTPDSLEGTNLTAEGGDDETRAVDITTNEIEASRTHKPGNDDT